METILGAGGAIGRLLAKELSAYTSSIRLVSRNPQKVNPHDELMALDLSKKEAVQKAVAGSSIVYVTIGFPYRRSVWEKLWPPFIDHVISACLNERARLVFFDNVYMYDKEEIPYMTEESKVNPPSKKGKIRLQVIQKIEKAMHENGLEALIARSADFYGPSIEKTSMLTETVINNLQSKKTAMWMADLDKKHAFTFTPDAAKAVALLGHNDSAFGQTWHLPTADNPPTGREWIAAFAEAMNAPNKSRVLSAGFLKFLGLFIPVMREMPEMLYQYDRDYLFSSQKFEEHFDFHPTPYTEGIQQVIDQL